ncbi:MobF family relaxase [Nocardioides sp. GY 10127]|uniref:MobF family relaxase n=1 Tax=Nocardioides sp. GY 10127 TaxID=2569762 RepID=UPI0010A838C3|nr:MobF family relaxase [Nocardioides sp. GY 10127]
MGLHKLSAGDGYTYLTRQVAIQDATERGRSGLAEYYSDKGEVPGRWWGSGLAGLAMEAGAEVTEQQMRRLFGQGVHPNSTGGQPVALGQPFRAGTIGGPLPAAVARACQAWNAEHGLPSASPVSDEVRADIRTRIADELFLEQHGRRPRDARERHAFLAQESRVSGASVAGFDLTFTPVKSVSVLWALAGAAVAHEIEVAHAAAVQDALRWAEQHVLFTRCGHDGVRQVPTRGMVATAFTHRDSRAGDPNLHTHVAVSNKVQGPDGAWRAIDGRVLFKAKVTLSEHYNTRLEAELTHRLGVTFTERTDGAQRPIREVVGVDDQLARRWSSRSAAIEDRRSQLAVAFQTDHGRPPTNIEAIALAQQANLETRQAKHEPRSEAEQRRTWAAEAGDQLGSPAAVQRMLHRALRSRRTTASPATERPRPEQVQRLARTVVQTLEAGRATWQEWHVRAEAHRQARYANTPLPHVAQLVDDVVEMALTQESVALPDIDEYDPALRHTPDSLRRADGTPMHLLHGRRRHTSSRMLAAEQTILRASERLDGRTVTPAAIDAALDDIGGRGHVLSPDQQAVVRALASSPRQVELVLAPAGSGKTTTVRALVEAWQAEGGSVIGLAPSAVAAHELQEALATPHAATAITCETLTKFIHAATSPPAPGTDEVDGPDGLHGPDERTLLLIDEAGMAGTLELATAIAHVTSRGGTVRLIGDDRQLASVAAGGVLRDLRHRHGAHSLTQLHRFVDPVEGAATLALRAGDPSVTGFYADRGRLHVGDATTAAEQAFHAWTNDIAAGLDSLLLAPTRDEVRHLNLRAQAHHATAQPGPSTALSDGERARVGDTVLTRKNARGLALSPTDWVRNGDRWLVTAIHEDGAVTVRRRDTHRDRATTAGRALSVVLPASYVREHTSLGYASTVHAAQGLTVDTTHAVLSGRETRELVYVGMTRGRRANHAYLTVSHDGGHDSELLPQTRALPTPVELFTALLQRTDEPTSATTTRTAAHPLDEDNPADLAHLVRQAALRYVDALHRAIESQFTDAQLTALDQRAAEVPDLTSSPTWETLRAVILTSALAAPGTTAGPAEVLDAAVRQHHLIGVHDPAAVLLTRLRTQPSPTAYPSLPWLPGIPRVLGNDATWGRYLDERASWLTTASTHLAQASTRWTDQNAPAWAQPLVGSSHDDGAGLLADVAVWRAAEGVADTEPDPLGTPLPGVPGRHQSKLRGRIHAAQPPLPVSLPPAVSGDPWAPTLLTRLETWSDQQHLSLGDVQAAVDAAADGLPTEAAASALWWRLHSHPLSTGAGPAVRPAPYDPLPRTPADCEPAEPVDPGPDPRWAVTSATSRARILELNALAHDFYRQHYAGSWAPAYLESRFGTPLLDHPTIRPGYAPPGPCSLTTRLLAEGATLEELLDAGLTKMRQDDTTADVFRDRVVLPIHDTTGRDIVGFVGRRNPAREDDRYAGPKYLNTRTTPAYAKSTSLYGLGEHRHLLAQGAIPTLVEGPMDATAVTLASNGDAVGIALLGTALTAGQVHSLRQSLTVADRNSVDVWLDPDDAGQAAQRRVLDELGQAGLYNRALHEALDPASALEQRAAADPHRPR